jgi:D-glycero-D-manno-heptose 1,7-bisphosphate phosphatase
MNFNDIRLVIFDADGTLRRRKDGESKAPLNNDEWEIMPGIEKAIDSIRHLPIVFGIASNQACIGRGEIKDYVAHVMLNSLSRKLNLAIDIESPCIQMCPHKPGICACRKPQPGMLYAIMMYWEIPPEKTLFIGDSDTDAHAAMQAGVQFMFTKDFLKKE